MSHKRTGRIAYLANLGLNTTLDRVMKSDIPRMFRTLYDIYSLLTPLGLPIALEMAS